MNKDNKDKNTDDLGERKDTRRKNLKNKFLDKKDRIDDDYSPKIRKAIKKRMEDMRADEIWDDWENNYDQ